MFCRYFIVCWYGAWKIDMAIYNSGVEDPTQYKIDMSINYSSVEDHPKKF